MSASLVGSEMCIRDSFSALGPDSRVKRRVAWGLRRSLANGSVRQGERIVLPRISDVIADTIDPLRARGLDQISFLGTGVANVFHQ
eukprot:579014-Alexandrium_andersonii.AAC.1